MVLLTVSRKTTTLGYVKKAQTTADRTRSRVEKLTVLFKYGVLTNKATIFEIHLRCADPRSILATMFHGQKVLSARPKPCCRLTNFQIPLSSRFFPPNTTKSNVSVGFKHGGREILKCHGLCALHEAGPDSSHTPLGQASLRPNECPGVNIVFLVTPGGKRRC